MLKKRQPRRYIALPLALCTAFLVFAAPSSIQADSGNTVGKIFGAIIGGVQKAEARKSWDAVDPEVLACLKFAGLNVDLAIQKAIPATHPQLAPYVEQCQKRVTELRLRAAETEREQQTLKKEQRAAESDAITELTARAQRLLTVLGYDSGPIDGVMGSRTRAAVLAFQRDQRLPVDDRVSEALIAQLSDALADATESPTERSKAGSTREREMVTSYLKPNEFVEPAVGISLEKERLIGNVRGRPRGFLISSIVDSVFPGGPADQAGLKKGDQIVAIGGIVVDLFRETNATFGLPSTSIRAILLRKAAGEEVEFRIRRSGKVLHIPVVLAEARTIPTKAPQATSSRRSPSKIELQSNSSQRASQLAKGEITLKLAGAEPSPTGCIVYFSVSNLTNIRFKSLKIYNLQVVDVGKDVIEDPFRRPIDTGLLLPNRSVGLDPGNRNAFSPFGMTKVLDIPCDVIRGFVFDDKIRMAKVFCQKMNKWDLEAYVRKGNGGGSEKKGCVELAAKQFAYIVCETKAGTMYEGECGSLTIHPDSRSKIFGVERVNRF